MNWREIKLGDLAGWAGKAASDIYESGAQYAKSAAQYVSEKSLGEMADDATELAGKTAELGLEGLKQAQHIIAKAPKESLGAAGTAATAATVGGAGIASGGTAVGGSVILGGLAAIPAAPGLVTAALIGGAGYLAYRAYQKSSTAAIPPAEPVGDWAASFRQKGV